MPKLYSSDLYSAHLFSILSSSVRDFPDFSSMVADLPCFSVVKNLIRKLCFVAVNSEACFHLLKLAYQISFNFYPLPYLFADLSIIFGLFKRTIRFLQISQLVKEINAFISITMIHLLRLFARTSVTVSVTTLMNTVTVESS